MSRPAPLRLPELRRLLAGLALGLLLGAAGGCGGDHPPPGEPVSGELGIASYYAHKFNGRTTASGEIYDETAATAAHRTLPFGTRVRVTNLKNGLSVVLRINDRGPWKDGRVIDVSYRAARDLGMLRSGLARVRVEVVEAD